MTFYSRYVCIIPGDLKREDWHKSVDAVIQLPAGGFTAFGNIMQLVESKQAAGCKLDWGAFLAKFSKTELKDYLKSDPLATPEILAAVDKLDDNQEYAVVVEET